MEAAGPTRLTIGRVLPRCATRQRRPTLKVPGRPGLLPERCTMLGLARPRWALCWVYLVNVRIS